MKNAISNLMAAIRNVFSKRSRSLSDLESGRAFVRSKISHHIDLLNDPRMDIMQKSYAGSEILDFVEVVILLTEESMDFGHGVTDFDAGCLIEIKELVGSLNPELAIYSKVTEIVKVCETFALKNPKLMKNLSVDSLEKIMRSGV